MKCKNCKEVFKPARFNWKYCDKDECNNIGVKEIISKVRVQKKKDQRKETKEAKIKLMTHSNWLMKLQEVVNKFIRIRDKDKDCVSCGAISGRYTMSAGHFYPAGNYSFLRFHEDNIHGQCWFNCNKNKHGNVGEYRLKITERITEEDLKWLDDNRNKESKLSIPEIQEEIKKYKDKIKSLT